MSLTNDQITAQNFKDFYGQIRPYLNGQVPTFANSFSRSDILSTTEKIVGTDTDGMPIYQKTLVIQNTAITDGTTVAHNISNFKKGWVVSCFLYATDGKSVQIPYISSSGKVVGTGILNITSSAITFRGSETWQAADYHEIYVTLRYTKSGDTAIKVGTGNDYSTDEQIVGSWIDGKPLYQRTWTGLSIFVTTGSSAWIVMTGVNIPNGKLIDAIFLTDGYLNSVPQQYWIRPATGNLETINWAESRTIETITVKYTKTTD